jgi:hypothetical protein
MTKAKRQKLYAFWKYDQFPYVLGGEVVEILDNGAVSTTNYQGFALNPIRVMPLEAGRRLHEKLRKLVEARRVAIDKVNDEYNSKLVTIFGKEVFSK